MSFLLEMMRLGLTNLRLRLLRSILTALGIILGVAAVITMVAIGEGSTREALRQIEALGARNIIVRSQKPPESQQQGQQRGFITAFGLTRDDLGAVQAAFPEADAIVPLKTIGSEILRGADRQVSQSFGTTPSFQQVANLTVERGRYLNEDDAWNKSMVAVIGSEVAKQMFPFDDPLGSTIRIDQSVFEVVGILQAVGLAGGAGPALVGRNLNLDVHIPIEASRSVFGDTVTRRTAGSFDGQRVQISEIYMAVPGDADVLGYASVLERLIEHRHPGLTDIELVVPYELLAKARRSKLTGRIMLAFIAAISLLVGGIGIMNIMLATVMERTREIGIRRALGATRFHVVGQFLIETTVLSAIGGLLGVAIGWGTSLAIDKGVPILAKTAPFDAFLPDDAALPTAPTLWSAVLAFSVAAITGLAFGIYPALRASQQDPIVALRHD